MIIKLIKTNASNAPFCSVSLIECGPVNTDFLVNLQKAELGDECLQKVDKQTLGLYEKFLQHCSSIFQNSAQDTEDIVKVCLINNNTITIKYMFSCVFCTCICVYMWIILWFSGVKTDSFMSRRVCHFWK